MKYHKYKITYGALVLFSVIIFSTSILLQQELKRVKEKNYEKNIEISEENLPSESISLWSVIEILNRKDFLSIEEIKIYEGFKEIILTYEKELNEIKEELSMLMDLEIIKDIMEIKYHKELWYLSIIFH